MTVNVPETKTYSQCIDLISLHLEEIAARHHGALKEWCNAHAFNYGSCVRIKNKNMSYYLPKMMIKLFYQFGYKASITRQYTDGGSTEDVFIVIKTQDVKTPGSSPAL
jgi:hypothetical protein